MKDHHRLLSRLYNTPLAISQDKLEIISSEVTLKLLAGQTLAREVATPTSKDAASSEKVVVIKVFDSLVAKGGAGESGFTSYEGITNQIKAAVSSGASKIGFYIDSPGGEAFGNFPLAQLIRELPTKHGVETFSFTDGAMHSAAYAIGSAAQKVYATASSSVGSIGTLITLVDKTKANEQQGYSYTILRSKPEKALGSPLEGYSEEAIAKYEAILQEMDSLFNETVNANRPSLSIQNIVDMKGASFMATKGLELNLIDSIVASFDEVLSIESSLTTTKPRGNDMTLEELKAQLAAKEQELATMQAQVTGIVAKAISDERVRCIDILSSASTLKISQEQAIKRINAGTSKEDSLEIFTAISEAVGVATAIDTSGSSATATVDTIVTGAADKLAIEGLDVSMSDILAAAKSLNKGAK